jgi:hypothetical protein
MLSSKSQLWSSAFCLLHAGFMLGLLFDPEDGDDIVTFMGIHVMKIMSSSSDDWSYWHYSYKFF